MRSRKHPFGLFPTRTAILFLVVLGALAIGTTPALAQPGATAESAVELYESGRYAEAGKILTQLDERGELNGSLLYRLYYCQRHANDPKAPATLERAIAPLEAESAGGETLEPAFYLVNTYTNLGRSADATRVAMAATSRVESGSIGEPTSGLEQFRLGKLYADAGNDSAAERWFVSAIEAFSAEDGSKHAAYVTWAAGYLADASFASEDYMAAAGYYERLLEGREPTMASLDQLAVARTRAGLYPEAGKAWRQAELLDPANANRARYCYRLVEAAGRMELLSATAPDGRLWPQLAKEELQAMLIEQVTEVRTVQNEAVAAESLDGPQRARLQRRLDTARSFFVPAAIEYALQGNSIRELAFLGGYAPLVFKEREWRVLRR